KDLRDAFSAWIDTARSMGRDIPKPGADGKPVAALVRFPRSLHEELTEIADREGVSFNQFVVTSLSCVIGARTAASSLWWSGAAMGRIRQTSRLASREHQNPYIAVSRHAANEYTIIAERATGVAKSVRSVTATAEVADA